jgi:tetraacyldisaccharide 4'-kinase
LKLLASIFGLAVQARNALYDAALVSTRRLEGPVISVGNLTVGGSGKTPFVILLGELLKARGIEFDVLSRGYGRKSKGIELVDPSGSPEQFGDEPLLIARRLEVPVIVGANRYQVGKFSEGKFGPRLHLLDDGFQHRALARDFDIVLISPEDAHDILLPVGRLREPLSSLKRADAVVFTNETSLNESSENSQHLRGKLAWRVQRGIRFDGIPEKPLVFCGIAKPRNFVSQLRTEGIEPAAEKFNRDHHAYTEQDIQNLLLLRQRSGAGGFVTTEKDAINLGRHLSKLQPTAIVSVTMTLENADSALDAMLRLIGERKRSA